MKQSTVRSAGKTAADRDVAAKGGENWARLHETDLEPYPDEKLVSRLAAEHPEFGSWVEQSGGPEHVARGLQKAWAEFHAGSFLKAIAHGQELGALGASVANKAAAVYSLYPKPNDGGILKMLENAMKRGEQAVQVLPDYANAHYNLALVIGRYSQRISILKALAEGLAGRVREHLERTLKLEPRHAEAHIAMGLYHTEIIGKLGALAARLTYNASGDEALRHFQRAIKLAPHSPIALMEHANGLLLLDATSNQNQARKLYAKAAALKPADAMETLDVERAKGGI
jgi:tetratricopeptide (TPR) repeat protein